MQIESQRLSDLLEAFTGKRVIVLGDVMLDEFTWGRVRRISPEAPVPVVEVLRETDHVGGAANAAANIRALGGAPLTIAVIGRDGPGERLISRLRSLDIDADLLVADDSRRTTLKTRIIAHSQQVVRADREDRTPLAPEINRALAERFTALLSRADAVVVSDYDKGVVNAELLGIVLPEAARAGVPVFLDPKVHHADYYRPATLITPNLREAELLSGMAIENATSLDEAGRRLLERFACPYLLITRGEEGMSLFEAGRIHHMPAAAREIFDVTGAGDTVIATLALARAAGAAMDEAAWIANNTAGIVVGKVGTASVTRQELTEFLRSR